MHCYLTNLRSFIPISLAFPSALFCSVLEIVMCLLSHLWFMTASQALLIFDDLDSFEDYWLGILYTVPQLGLI